MTRARRTRSPRRRVDEVNHGMRCAGRAKTKEADVLMDFGKKFLLGLMVAACLVGAHAAVVYSVVG